MANKRIRLASELRLTDGSLGPAADVFRVGATAGPSPAMMAMPVDVDTVSAIADSEVSGSMPGAAPNTTKGPERKQPSQLAMDTPPRAARARLGICRLRPGRGRSHPSASAPEPAGSPCPPPPPPRQELRDLQKKHKDNRKGPYHGLKSVIQRLTEDNDEVKACNAKGQLSRFEDLLAEIVQLQSSLRGRVDVEEKAKAVKDLSDRLEQQATEISATAEALKALADDQRAKLAVERRKTRAAQAKKTQSYESAGLPRNLATWLRAEVFRLGEGVTEVDWQALPPTEGMRVADWRKPHILEAARCRPPRGGSPPALRAARRSPHHGRRARCRGRGARRPCPPPPPKTAQPPPTVRRLAARWVCGVFAAFAAPPSPQATGRRAASPRPAHAPGSPARAPGECGRSSALRAACARPSP